MKRSFGGSFYRFGPAATVLMCPKRPGGKRLLKAKGYIVWVCAAIARGTRGASDANTDGFILRLSMVNAGALALPRRRCAASPDML